MDTCGSYQPASAVAAAGALRWVPYEDAVAAVRGLLGASYNDLLGRHLVVSFSEVFFPGRDWDGAVFVKPFEARKRFPEGAQYICADRPPLAEELRSVSRMLVRVAKTKAREDVFDEYNDAVDELLRKLVGKDGRCPAAIDREKFESEFSLRWVPE